METHKGSCHCGKVKFTVNAELKSGMVCNCSMCGRKGTILAFVPSAQFHLESGENNLTDYQFGKKRIHHLFCKTCGVTSFAKGTGPKGEMMAAINLRCLEDFDPNAIQVTQFDGKAL